LIDQTSLDILTFVPDPSIGDVVRPMTRFIHGAHRQFNGNSNVRFQGLQTEAHSAAYVGNLEWYVLELPHGIACVVFLQSRL
jgi:hypothetical protein